MFAVKQKRMTSSVLSYREWARLGSPGKEMQSRGKSVGSLSGPAPVVAADVDIISNSIDPWTYTNKSLSSHI